MNKFSILLAVFCACSWALQIEDIKDIGPNKRLLLGLGRRVRPTYPPAPPGMQRCMNKPELCCTADQICDLEYSCIARNPIRWVGDMKPCPYGSRSA